MSEQTKPAKNPPVKQFRAGAVSVSIFKREHNGDTFYNAVASRAYTKDDGKTWEYSDSFGRDEIPVVARLLDMAFAWIVSQQQPKA